VRRHNLVGKDLITWHNLGPLGATWGHLGPLGTTWHHLAHWPGAPRFGAMIWTGTADYTFLGNGFPHSVHAFDRLCRALAAQARYLQAAPGDGRAGDHLLLRRRLAERVQGALPLRRQGAGATRLCRRGAGLSNLSRSPIPGFSRRWRAGCALGERQYRAVRW